MATLTGCGGFELPTPPDMTALVKEYESPDGTLTGDNAKVVAEDVGTTFPGLRDRAPTEVVDALVAAMQKLGGGSATSTPPAGSSPSSEPTVVGAGEQSVAGNKIDVGASVKMHHICRGWQAEKVVDEKTNGNVEVSLALDRRGLLPTIWGHLEHCRLQHNGGNLELTGDLNVHFGTTQPRIGFQYLTQIAYFVEFSGHVKAMKGDQSLDVDTHFTYRIFPDGHVHMAVDLADGTNVILALDAAALVGTDPSLDTGLLARNVTWACQFDLAAVSGSCADGADAASVIKW